MKKMRKLLAVLMTLAMVMGLGMTTFAANEATIQVDGAGVDAKFQYAQVIKADTKTTTGWNFLNDVIAKAYTDAFGTRDAQVAIDMLIKYAAGETEGAATAGQIDQALTNVVNSETTFNNMSNPQTVNAAGVYAITATETGYVYKTMSAYIGFGKVTEKEDGEDVTHEYPALVDATVNAKKVPTDVVVEKNGDADGAVAIGDEVSYTVKAIFPYFDPTRQNTFVVYDNINGASYVLEKAKVMIGTEDVTEKVEFELNETETGFTVDLTQFIAGNTYANKEVVITYSAIVTALTVDNEAGTNISDASKDSVELYTGKITLTKFAEDGTTPLADAGFNVYKGETMLKFDAAEIAEDGTKVYTYNKEGSVTEVVTGTNGKLVVQGLDVGAYCFDEVTAPKGYSINEEPAEAELVVDGKATEVFYDVTSMIDTKLNALPATGGIGTTIFTIGGCAIMVAAAYMYFVSRRKEEE